MNLGNEFIEAQAIKDFPSPNGGRKTRKSFVKFGTPSQLSRLKLTISPKDTDRNSKFHPIPKESIRYNATNYKIESRNGIRLLPAIPPYLWKKIPWYQCLWE
ncbi:hypothetical protein PoB_000239600 [Plakobranchus ocellatus]|uniref:Uncharacterized protein n=1 Tax=Plakobranchus ocellatus TaxID=259542 RepID=A0AAV3X9N9_9GAST|nr:hypothetical protein PoB_000239600 [Plakobranchus ocellatus]